MVNIFFSFSVDSADKRTRGRCVAYYGAIEGERGCLSKWYQQLAQGQSEGIRSYQKDPFCQGAGGNSAAGRRRRYTRAAKLVSSL
jgi:hypothetical protein